MQAFTTLQGSAVPLMLDNIDTDVIIRVERMTLKSQDAMKPYAFEALRYHADGTFNPDCVLNQEKFRDAPILLAGNNFGCGSSREPAVWAVMSLGVRCVIAESFGDIFSGNCFQNGVLAIALPRAQLNLLASEAAAAAAFTVNLAEQIISTPGGAQIPFCVDPVRKESLVEGLNEVEQTLRWSDTIRTWQAGDRQRRPWAWSTVARPAANAARSSVSC